MARASVSVRVTERVRETASVSVSVRERVRVRVRVRGLDSLGLVRCNFSLNACQPLVVIRLTWRGRV